MPASDSAVAPRTSAGGLRDQARSPKCLHHGCRRVNKTQAFLITTFRVPVYERDWTLRDEVGLLAYWDSDHTVEYSPDTLIAELVDAGLEVDELFLRWGEIWAPARTVTVLSRAT